MTVYIIIGIAVFLTAIVYLIVVLSKKQRAKTTEALADVAEKLGAQLDPGDWKTKPVLSGSLDGRDYELTFRVVQAGNTQVTYLDLKSPFEAEDFRLSLKKFGAGAKFFNMLGLGKRIKSGDPAFDAKVLVKGEPKSKITPMSYDVNFKLPATRLIERGYAVEIKAPGAVASKIYNMKKDLSAEILSADIDAFLKLIKRCR